ncbi:uncharacterized protein [Symphalangus syndactylus]|uniref:uncharacterized protein isoform X1 n=1 Tax=Symphalangus syndactylus TaxID=9590 RepID=UPI003005AFF6
MHVGGWVGAGREERTGPTWKTSQVWVRSYKRERARGILIVLSGAGEKRAGQEAPTFVSTILQSSFSLQMGGLPAAGQPVVAQTVFLFFERHTKDTQQMPTGKLEGTRESRDYFFGGVLKGRWLPFCSVPVPSSALHRGTQARPLSSSLPPRSLCSGLPPRAPQPLSPFAPRPSSNSASFLERSVNGVAHHLAPHVTSPAHPPSLPQSQSAWISLQSQKLEQVEAAAVAQHTLLSPAPPQNSPNSPDCCEESQPVLRGIEQCGASQRPCPCTRQQPSGLSIRGQIGRCLREDGSFLLGCSGKMLLVGKGPSTLPILGGSRFQFGFMISGCCFV